MADFFADLLSKVAAHSFTLQQDGTTRHPEAVSYNPLSSRRTAKLFRTSLMDAVTELIQPQVSGSSEVSGIESGDVGEGLDTVVYPLVQMGHYGIHQDELATQRLLSGVDRTDMVYLASGYFNLPPQYTDAILRGQGKCHVLAASPQVYLGTCTRM